MALFSWCGFYVRWLHMGECSGFKFQCLDEWCHLGYTWMNRLPIRARFVVELDTVHKDGMRIAHLANAPVVSSLRINFLVMQHTKYAQWSFSHWPCLLWEGCINIKRPWIKKFIAICSLKCTVKSFTDFFFFLSFMCKNALWTTGELSAVILQVATSQNLVVISTSKQQIHDQGS